MRIAKFFSAPSHRFAKQYELWHFLPGN
ncbi:hypothetical protein J2789_006531 [Variovorax paradoxus]|nr:hypothetical protein [Variovorax paradoxus]